MTDFKPSWLNAKKPWTKAVCRDYYVFGEDEPTLQSISQKSGRKLQTLKDWSRYDNWKLKRREYKTELYDELLEKVVNTESDRLLEEFLGLNKQHKDTFKLIRLLSTNYLKAMCSNDTQALKNFDAVSFQRISAVFSQAVDGERRAFNADLLENSRAFGQVLRQGYEIRDPDSDRLWSLQDE